MESGPDIDFGLTVIGFVPGRRVFGRFALVRQLGRGGMGLVWLAHDEKLKLEVALKFLPEAVGGDEVAVANLARETRRARELAHPHIVRVYDFHQDERLAGISMEWVDGSTLSGLRLKQRDETFAPAELGTWVGQLCGALDYAHGEAKVVHRDLKPANLMIDVRGRLKIADFGISASVSESVTRVSRVASSSGSPPYMSPQQMMGAAPAVADDIYSLGATLYELVTGRPPFFSGNILAQAQSVVPPPLAARRRELGLPAVEIPAAWEEALAACLAKDPARRPASAGEVAARLAGGAAGPSAAHLGTEAPTIVGPRPVGAQVPVRGVASEPSRRAEGPARPPSEGVAVAAKDETPPRDRRRSAPRHRRALWVAMVAAAMLAAGGAAWRFWPHQRAAEQIAAGSPAAAPNVAVGSSPQISPREPSTPPPEASAGGAGAPRRLSPATPEPPATPPEASTGGARAPRGPSAAAPSTEAAVAASRPATPPEPGDQVPPTQPAAAGFTLAIDPADAPNLQIWLGDRSDLKAERGVVRVPELPDNEYELVVQADGYQPVVTRVRVAPDARTHEVRLVPLRGRLEIVTSPGASVTAVDAAGRETRLGVADAAGRLVSDNVLRIGRYTVRLAADKRAAAEAPVELAVGRPAKIERLLAALPGQLRIISVPSGAEVKIDGRVAGTTPANVRDLSAEQALRVEIFQRGYRRVEQTVTLQPQEVRTLNAGTLAAEAGAVELRMANAESRMENVRVAVDGREVAIGGAAGLSAAGQRLLVDGLEVGARTFEIEHPDYEPWQQAVTVRDRQTTPVEVALAPKPAMLTLTVRGPDEYELLVNDRQVAVRDSRVSLPAGRELTLALRARGFKEARRALTPRPNGAETWSVALEKLAGPESGQPWTVPELGLEMVFILPGTFTMGSPASEAGRFDDEGPQTRVTLTRGFWLGKYEVTQGQWQALMGSNPSHFKNAGANAPVEQVSWNDAMTFCRKLTERERAAGRLSADLAYTLPTEAQWEYACRAGTSIALYSGPLTIRGRNNGPELDPIAWYGGNSGVEYAGGYDSSGWPEKQYEHSRAGTHPVGQKRPNFWGVYDMLGNVWEWCADWKGDYPGGTISDPSGPSSGSGRVGRGGGWRDYARYCRSALRGRDEPGNRSYNLGFRLALSSVR